MPSDGASHCMTIYDRGQPVFYARSGWIGRPRGLPRSSCLAQCQHGAFQNYIQYRNNQLTGPASLGAVGLDWQLGGFAPTTPTGSMGRRSARVKRTARAGDSGFWWRQWRSRRIECWRRQCRGTSAVADHTAAHMTARRFWRCSSAIATSREGHRLPRSGSP
jgi:hypothetical protein